VDLPETPARVEDGHDQDAQKEEKKGALQEALTEGDLLLGGVLGIGARRRGVGSVHGNGSGEEVCGGGQVLHINMIIS
jgi:hypothetical protein